MKEIRAMSKAKVAVLIMAGAAAFTACTRTYMVKTDSTKSVIDQVNVMAIEYHRPEFAPADHDDFKNKSRTLECMHPQELWSESMAKAGAVASCLNSITEGVATYFYVPATQPYLELEMDEKSNPACLKEHLAKIPLPREVYFLGKELGKNGDDEPLECFSMSFNTTTNQVMKTDIEFLKIKKRIKIPFPVSRPLTKASDVSLWLSLEVFSILKSDSEADGQLIATLVPEATCRRCFRNDKLFDDKLTGKIKPVLWP